MSASASASASASRISDSFLLNTPYWFYCDVKVIVGKTVNEAISIVINKMNDITLQMPVLIPPPTSSESIMWWTGWKYNGIERMNESELLNVKYYWLLNILTSLSYGTYDAPSVPSVRGTEERDDGDASTEMCYSDFTTDDEDCEEDSVG